jgi:thiamine biosynthesis lipoprotein
MTTPLPAPAARPATGTVQWPVWSTLARVVVTDPDRLDGARLLVGDLLAEVDAAASRFRTDSELNTVHGATGRPVRVSPLLAGLVAAALDAARRTEGDVDPTVGVALAGLGYDRDLTELDRDVRGLPLATGFTRIVTGPAPSWRRVRLAGDVLTVPAGMVLDLGATAKAWTADRAADLVAARLGTGVLVSLGGDIATAGPGPHGGWQIRVQDADGEPGCDVALPAGAAIATSSTIRRQWRHGERAVHHILNPRSLAPADPVWRTVTIAADRCVDANTLTTAAMVRGEPAWTWLNGLGVAARLVRHDGAVLVTGAWPSPGGGAPPVDTAAGRTRPRMETSR